MNYKMFLLFNRHIIMKLASTLINLLGLILVLAVGLTCYGVTGLIMA